ncbi:hypothetical protein GIB67_008259 [Kingdonia uniflora]|uniref:Membrane-associated kinase regulator 5 n=1 Tax=Kingdonia uniflora TaxID=39325 RepID=A0A7J7N544_9MAGN|nr:hypothetical protein GIB67_008259 [Kingdonia uniflora]
MEAFSVSLLRYWRANTGTGAKISSTISERVVDDEDNGPFFDMDFAPFDYDTISLSQSESAQSTPTSSFPKSPAKFRVFMFGFIFSKSKSNKEGNVISVEDEVQIGSLFTRSNSAKDTKVGKDLVFQKYLKMIRPLSIKVSKTNGEKSKSRFFREFETTPVSVSSPMKETPSKIQTFPSGFRRVCKNLGKSRSGSAIVTPVVQNQAMKRVDSVTQQEDVIQSAILHCKRSFNLSPESDSSLLTRSMSDPSHQKLFSRSCSLKS